MKNVVFEKLKTLDKVDLEQNELNLYKGNPQYNLIQKAIKKEKLTIEEQVEYMKFKGITFNHTSETRAKEYLKENSYYYKVTAYRKNFTKDAKNKYQNLDFATLKDMAIIDMHLRYLLLKLALDIEHAIKTILIKLITNSDEDGYSIIEEYNKYQYDSIDSNPRLTPEQKREQKKNYKHSAERILEDSKGYHRDLFEKHHANPSIWVLIEVMSYGQLASFVKFYVDKKKFGYKDLTNASDFMHYSKNIRDSAAHSRPILLNIIEPMQFKPKMKVTNYLIKEGIPKPLVHNNLTNVKVHDLCCILYLHDIYVKGSKTRKERKKEMISLFQRARRENQLYPEPKKLEEVLTIFGILIMKY
jgi:hypothetical protein